MKKNTRRSRRHRNAKSKEGEKQAAFFSKTSDNKVQTKEDKSFFQPKLEVSGPNDPAEKEADAVANNVVHNVKAQKSAGVQKKEMVNRQAEKEEPAAKLQRMAEKEEPAAKLQRQAEKEEPAAKLQRMAEKEEPAAKLQRQAEKEEPTAKLQRMADKEEPAAKLKVQTKGESINKSAQKNQKKKEATSVLEQMIQETKGKGFALPNDVRADMEGEFNVDFSDVRIHTGLAAIKMCNMINAQAFTHGFDIYFNDGKYNPDTETGQNLLAHELTHVVQQKGG